MSSERRACLPGAVRNDCCILRRIPVPTEKTVSHPALGTWFCFWQQSRFWRSSFFYRGVNILAEYGSGSIGYSVAQGSSIAGFLIFEDLFRQK